MDDNENEELNNCKKQLEKSFKLIRKYRNKYYFETEVCKEFAKRIDILLKNNEKDREYIKKLQSSVATLTQAILDEDMEKSKQLALYIDDILKRTPNSAKQISNQQVSNRQTSKSSAVGLSLASLEGTSLLRKSTEVSCNFLDANIPR
jgi:hypothetical protein